MRVSWIVPGFQSDETDRCIPALTDLAHQVATKHRLKVYALQYPHRRDSYRIGQVEIESFGTGQRGKVARLERICLLTVALKAIQSQPGELLHAFWAAEPALLGAVAAKLTGRKLIVSFMGGEAVYLPEIAYGVAHRLLDRFYVQAALKGATHLTCGSNTLAELLVARYGERVKPLVLPLGVDLVRFRAPDPRTKPLPDKPLLLAVGSLLSVKGYANLIKAVAQVPEVKLRIVGEGPERPGLKQLIRSMHLEERVSLAGQVAPEEISGEYARADLLVLSSYYESQCVALVEGMACGLPVVAAPVGLAPALLQSNRAGELASGNAPIELSRAITRLLARRTEWAELRKAAREAAATLSLENCSGNFLQLYRAVSSE
ncbi:MAG TPA: glycosyltransferase family 4 protein [Chloroflexia bacterium]|nr:glycosyltransferase family 4 protein [Chloroflexia bacterium]